MKRCRRIKRLLLITTREAVEGTEVGAEVTPTIRVIIMTINNLFRLTKLLHQ